MSGGLNCFVETSKSLKTTVSTLLPPPQSLIHLQLLKLSYFVIAGTLTEEKKQRHFVFEAPPHDHTKTLQTICTRPLQARLRHTFPPSSLSSFHLSLPFLLDIRAPPCIERTLMLRERRHSNKREKSRMKKRRMEARRTAEVADLKDARSEE